MLRRFSFSWVNLVLFLGFIAAMVLSISESHHCADSIRKLRAFSVDEGIHVSLMIRNLLEGNFDPHGFFYHGYFYDEVCLVVYKAVRWIFSSASPVQLLATLSRVLSAFFLMGSALMAYRIGKLILKSHGLACAAAIASVTFTESLYWSQRIHPDTLQLFLILLAYWVSLSKQSRASALLASFVCGVAFGTKYGTLVNLPFLWLPVIMRDHAKGDWVRSLIKVASLGTLFFFLGWLIFNPYVLVQFQDFTRVFSEQMAILSRPADSESISRLKWFVLIASEYGWVGFTFLVIGVLFAFHRLFLIKNENDTITRARKVLTLSGAIGFAFVFLFLEMRTARNLFTILPFLILASFVGIESILAKQSAASRKALLVLVIVLSVYILPYHSRGSLSQRSDRLDICEHSPRIEAGNRLLDLLPLNSKIISDWYAYIPPEFENVKIAPGLTIEELKDPSTQTVIFTREYTGSYLWATPGKTFRERDIRISDTYANAAELKRMQEMQYYLFDQKSGYSLLDENKEVVVWSRVHK